MNDISSKAKLLAALAWRNGLLLFYQKRKKLKVVSTFETVYEDYYNILAAINKTC